ncbi:DUF7289 family protein [Natrialbaceae archaeon AArc-T1-2]|uniref:DUF7289 family protein n=1 Tax=Natrialbaceae archaeon AArc-T1-2 TaxID=3053904 RepID=UPI00255AEDEC|nr:hypothetical protein [Natrialbaceae archaeon AArc-T1-2]WIV67943.1 hypothetical protein QQ977_04210 [Natrialbaceae archaeon AArc-T1-2]
MTAADTESGGDERAQSAVLGVVLLIGVVAIASVGLLMLAAETTESLEQDAENERIEQSFVELSQTMASTAATGDTTEVLDFAAGEHGAVVKKDTGNIHLEGGDVDTNLSIGAIEYEADDGTRVAYQAGGVFYETGNQTRLVSAPPVHYDSATETFSFPVTTVSGETSLSSGEIAIKHDRTDPHRNATVVEDDSVTITIESVYYRGWQEYFERQAGDASVRNVTHPEADGEPGTVEVMVGYVEIDEAFEEGLIVGDDDGFSEQGSTGLSDDDWDAAPMPELDEMIEMMVEDAKSGSYEGGIDEDLETYEGGTLTSGSYYADEVDLDEELTAELEDGNVTLIVDGNVTVDDAAIDVDPAGTNNEFSIWTTEHVDVSSQDACVNDCPDSAEDADASQLQIYGTSDSHVSLGPGTSTFEGAIYVAGDDDPDENVVHDTGEGQCSSQVCIHSDVDFYGAIVASSIHAQGGEGSIDFGYDSDLADIDIYPKGYQLPPQLTYLNVVHHEVDVKQR